MIYTSERNHQIVIELLKYHGIKRIVASPGQSNVSFVATVQNDPFFEIYSSVDERSAAYIACGLAAESKEPVVLSCTGATASRNYYPGLTEAFYRNLPILAITSGIPTYKIGHNIPQLTDRTDPPSDCVKMSLQLPVVKDHEEEWICNIRVNQAILELKRPKSGPVHLNLETIQSRDFSASEIKAVNPVDRIFINSEFPDLSNKKIAVFVGNHAEWTEELTQEVDSFCKKYNSLVLCDHTSNYKGDFGILGGLASAQADYISLFRDMDILIHIGEISGAYLKLNPEQVWRIDADGKICDTFRHLRYVFEMGETEFFSHYVNSETNCCESTSYFEKCQNEYTMLSEHIPELPLSNVWVAKESSDKLPQNSVIHFGILNSLRSWNYFDIPKSVRAYCNTGGFGIDGCVSALLGASLFNPEKLYFGVVGDLAFFYDMNVLGNRHFGSNVRLIVINNGCGQEFKNYGQRSTVFEEKTNVYIAAGGHYGAQSSELVKNYAANLGFDYYAVNNKEEFIKIENILFSPEKSEKPIITEVFVSSSDETETSRIIRTLISDNKTGDTKVSAKDAVKNLLGDKGVSAIKKVLGR